MPFESFGPYRNEERMAPPFTLPDGAGRKVQLWDYKQRKPVVIYFLNDTEVEFLQRLQSEANEYQAMGAQLLVIVAADAGQVKALSENLNLSYPLLADPERSVHARYIQLVYPQYDPAQTRQKPLALFVADRYGSIYRYATATEPAKLPAQPEILELLEFLGNLCNP